MKCPLLTWAAKRTRDPGRVRPATVLAPVLPSFSLPSVGFFCGLVNFKEVFKMQELFNFIHLLLKNKVDQYRALAGSKHDTFLLISVNTAFRLHEDENDK